MTNWLSPNPFGSAKRAANPAVDDGFYIVGGIAEDYWVGTPESFDDEEEAHQAARELVKWHRSYGEADTVRVMTRDGELVKDYKV